MSILGKVFAGLNIVAALAFFFLAAITLQKHKQWREMADSLQAQVDQRNKQIFDLRWGTIQAGQVLKAGLLQRNTELHNLLVDRGRVWYEANPGDVDAATGATSVDIRMVNAKNEPVPHQIQGGGIVHIFDAAAKADGGLYLGQFKVTGLEGETKIALAPMRPLRPEEIKRLQDSRAKANASWTWVLYEVMPGDRNDLFAKLTDDELKALIPAETVEEYIKDGEAAGPNDPAERVKDGKYDRALRDYEVLFREYDRKMSVLGDRVAAAEDDNKAMAEAVADAQKHVEFEKQLIEQLKVELAQLQRERDAVVAHRQKLEEGLAGTRAKIAQLFDENKKMAAELAKMQAEQVEQIDGTTGAADGGSQTN